jgi:hypothetical protein
MESIATVAFLVALGLFIATGAPAFIALDQSHFANPNPLLARITSKWYFKATWLLSVFTALGFMRPAFPGLDRLYFGLCENYGKFIGALFLSSWLVASLVAILVASTVIIASTWHALELAPKLWKQIRDAYCPHQG